MEKVACSTGILDQEYIIPDGFLRTLRGGATLRNQHRARVWRQSVCAACLHSRSEHLWRTGETGNRCHRNRQQTAKARIDSELTGLEHETIVDWSIDLWDAVQKTIKEKHIDLIVMGTHGRTGADKFFMGSVAEEIFRRSPVPVLTIGPDVRSSVHTGGRFHRVLFPTDFTDASLGAAPYAISLAQENNARLVLLHVMRTPELRNVNGRNEYRRDENRPHGNEGRGNERSENDQRRFELPSPRPFISFTKRFRRTPTSTSLPNRSWNMETLPIEFWR